MAPTPPPPSSPSLTVYEAHPRCPVASPLPVSRTWTVYADVPADAAPAARLLPPDAPGEPPALVVVLPRRAESDPRLAARLARRAVRRAGVHRPGVSPPAARPPGRP